jgi:hypothetical protein
MASFLGMHTVGITGVLQKRRRQKGALITER